MTPSRQAIRESMAEQFLDSETRVEIPRTAALCVDAGLDASAAFDVWAFEVTPALWHNLWDVAGEWAGWDSAWLHERIERRRTTPSPWAHVVYRARVHFAHERWEAIARCIDLFQASLPEERPGLLRAFHWLAGHYFDFGPFGRRAPPEDPAHLRALYDARFLPIFAPIARDDRGDLDPQRFHRRVVAALEVTSPAGPPRILG